MSHSHTRTLRRINTANGIAREIKRMTARVLELRRQARAAREVIEAWHELEDLACAIRENLPLSDWEDET
jgi:hypothetical protein